MTSVVEQVAGDDRYKYRAKTPPAGVRNQIAAPPGEDWEGASALTPIRAMTELPPQSGSETAVEGIDRRVRETKNNTLETLDRVEALRGETRADIRDVHSKIDAVIEVVSDLREIVGKQGGQNELIIAMIDEQREQRDRSGMMRVTKFTAEVEVDKTKQLSQIEIERTGRLAEIADQKEARALRRDLIKKTAMQVLAGLGLVFAAYMAGRC